jgi:hypothetical protein
MSCLDLCDLKMVAICAYVQRIANEQAHAVVKSFTTSTQHLTTVQRVFVVWPSLHMRPVVATTPVIFPSTLISNFLRCVLTSGGVDEG